LLLLFRAGGFCSAQDALSFNDTLREVLAYLTGRIPANSTVVVLNFQSDYPNLSEYIIDDITSNLVNTDLFTVVDRRSLELLQQELAFQMSGEVSEEAALSIGRRLGAQMVISGAVVYLGELYRLRVQAIEVESARIVGSSAITIQSDRLLATLTENPWAGAGTDTPNAVQAPSNTGLFYLGLRGGFSTRFYQTNTDFWGPDASARNSFSGDFAAQASVQLFKFLALQAEAAFFAGDTVEIQRGSYPASLNYSAMMFPVLGKITLRPGSFLIAGFGGIYFTVPFEAMNFSINGQEYSYDYTAPKGFIAGGNIGIKLGPGTLFIDARYAGDFGATAIQGDWGSRTVYKRSLAFYSLGYEFGIGRR
jgi:TolB-like protein